MHNCDAFQYQVAINEKVRLLCQPLEKIGIKNFSYIKLYKNGQYFKIDNDLGLLEFYLKNIHSNYLGWGLPIKHINKFDIHLWPSSPQNEAMQLYLQKGYWNGITFKKQLIDSEEAWSFSTAVHDSNHQEFLHEHKEILIKFIQYFTLVAGDLMQIEKSKLAYFKNGIAPIPNHRHLLERNKNLLNIFENQLKENLQKYRPILSLAELKCIALLSHNLSYKEIGAKLNISEKTVEAHISNIKKKICLNSKSQLTLFFNEKFQYIESIF